MKIMDAERILILGGTGHLGSSMVHYLVNVLNYPSKRIRIFYLKNSPTNSLTDIEGLEFYPGNILDSKSVEHALFDCDLVFHMVGNTTFDPRQKELQWKVNVEGTKNVLEAMRINKSVKRLCYTSTVNVLGIPEPKGSLGTIENSNPYESKIKVHSFNSTNQTLSFIKDVEENNVQNWIKKINIGYFDSKLAAQELVSYYCKEYNLNIVSVLPGTMFGPYDYLINAGMYLLSIYKGIMPGVLPGGMPFMHVIDSVEGHIKAVEKGVRGEKYIITGREEDCLYLKEMTSVIADVLRQKEPNKKIKQPKFVFKKRIALIGAFFSELYTFLFNKPNPLSRDSVRGGILPSFYTYKETEKQIGYKPKRTFRKAVEEMYDYYKENNIFQRDNRYLDEKPFQK